MYISLMGTFFIAAIIGVISERSRFTHNGIIPSVVICVGGAFLFYMLAVMFRLGFGSAGMNAIVSSIGALIIVPTHWRK
jgi:uncharacterized membrane protein YeaQ/YmgE (transglycosylase-associated protein family)